MSAAREIRRLPEAEVLRQWLALYVEGKHKAAGTKPDAALKQYVGRDPTWIEVELPHDLYDADWNTEGDAGRMSPKTIERASEYARRPGRLPPGMAAYGARAARRSMPKVFVTDGNHRAYAAFLRGDPTARFYMPLREWERFREVIGA